MRRPREAFPDIENRYKRSPHRVWQSKSLLAISRSSLAIKIFVSNFKIFPGQKSSLTIEISAQIHSSVKILPDPTLPLAIKINIWQYRSFALFSRAPASLRE